MQTLKDKLELITGARSALMTIEVFDQNDVKVTEKCCPFLYLKSVMIQSQSEVRDRK